MSPSRAHASEQAAQSNTEPEPDPFEGMPETGDLQADTAAELGALSKGFRNRIATEGDRFRRAVDCRYWTAVCFQSEADRNLFLDALGMFDEGQYLNGYEVAKRMGLDMSEDTGDGAMGAPAKVSRLKSQQT